MKIVLIIGCLLGIGLDVVYYLCECGWQVILICCKFEDFVVCRDEGFEFLQFELVDDVSVVCCVDVVCEWGVMVLVNNVVFVILGVVEDLLCGVLWLIFEVNLFGIYDLIVWLLLYFCQSGGWVVQIFLVLGMVGILWCGVYVVMKFVLEGLIDVMCVEMVDMLVKLVLIELGLIGMKICLNLILYFERWIDWENSFCVQYYCDSLLQWLYYFVVKKDWFELLFCVVSEKIVLVLEILNLCLCYYVMMLIYFLGIGCRLLLMWVLDWFVWCSQGCL